MWDVTINIYPVHLQIAVLITNGRSDDQVEGPAKAVTDSGISLYAVGEFV